jgi:nucleoside-diphosphate-sugar epimerase
MNGEDFDMTSGEQIRSFSNVTHIVENIYECLYSDDSKHHFRNLGSDNPTSLKEFAEYWWKKLNAKGKLKLGALPYPDDEIMRYIPNLDY